MRHFLITDCEFAEKLATVVCSSWCNAAYQSRLDAFSKDPRQLFIILVQPCKEESWKIRFVSIQVLTI